MTKRRFAVVLVVLFSDAIGKFIRNKYNLLIGMITAEKLKIAVYESQHAALANSKNRGFVFFVELQQALFAGFTHMRT